MELIRAALGDLVENDAADAVLRRKSRGVDLEFGDRLKNCRIGVLAMGQRSGRSIRKDVAVRQVAVDRHFLARIGRTLDAADCASGARASGS